MPVTDKLDLSRPNLLDVIVDRRWMLIGIIFVASVALFFSALRLRLDPTLESGMDTTSEAYKKYQEFVQTFGNEEFILIAIKSDVLAGDPRLLGELQKITTKIEQTDKIAEVVSLFNLRVFQQRGDLLGSYPIVSNDQGKLSLPDADHLKALGKAIPVMHLLLSPDLKTVGVLVRVEDSWRLNIRFMKGLLAQLDRIVSTNLTAGSEYRIIGGAVIRQAIVRYNIQTGVIFGALCMLIGVVVSLYIFKSIRITAFSTLILLTCILWVLGFQALMGVPLNSTTALSFGFIPITTVEIVIHMVVRYHLFYQGTKEKLGAIKQCVRWLVRPCLICSSTTAVGFGSLMVSSIPMVTELGFIMSVGIMVSSVLCIVMTPFFLAVMKTFDAPEQSPMLRDWLEKVIQMLEQAIYRHYRAFVVVGVAISVFLFTGTPQIRSDPQLLRMLSSSTSVMKDLEFVQNNLGSVQSVELLLESPGQPFKKPEVWGKVAELEKRLKDVPEVEAVESILPLVEYLYGLFKGNPADAGTLFSDPIAIPQILSIMSLSTEGERLRLRYLNDTYDKLHVTVRIKNSPTTPIADTINRIESTANGVLQGLVPAKATGEMAVYADQTHTLIKDQIWSMFLAVVIITVIMMIQMQSVILGLICLIPNIPPVAAVFGIMGWCGIALDAITVFAATVAIGLAVDNTIHYLTQLKREMTVNGDQSIETCVGVSYRFTARQIASWCTITLLGFLALVGSPFRPVVFFGLLGCSAITLGLYGDLIFIQSLILASKTIRNTIKKRIERETAAQGKEPVA